MIKTQYNLIFFVLLVMALSLLSPRALAISLLDRRESKLLLNLDGANASNGDRFVVIDSEGKRRALIEILQIKEDKAVARITKGNLTQELSTYTVKSLPSAATTSVPTQPIPAPQPPAKRWKLRGRTGFLGGMAMNTIKVNLTSTSSVQLSGSSFVAEGFYEATIKGRYQVLFRGGMQSLKASGSLSSGSCGGSLDCSLDVTYLGGDLVGKFLMGSPRYRTWLGGGLSLLYGVSKSSNVVDSSKITFMQKLILGGGGQYPLSKRTFIPVQLEYDMFLNSSSVNATQILFRTGYGWQF